LEDQKYDLITNSLENLLLKHKEDFIANPFENLLLKQEDDLVSFEKDQNYLNKHL